MKSIWKRYGLFWALVVLSAAFDQWTKRLAAGKLMGNGPFVIWDGVFELLYSENRGAAFGILQGKQSFFFLVAAAVIIVIMLALSRVPLTKRYLPLFLCMAFLTSGAVGNMIDRMARGYVVDFFYFSLIDFPIFNVADCYVVVSAVFFVLLMAFVYKDDELEQLFKKEKEQ